MTPDNVLIVDDSPHLHKLIRSHLGSERVAIHSAYDGETALAKVTELQPSLVLMDIDMPGLDGLQACRRLKANPMTADIPVIFLTGDCSTHDKVKAFEMGAVDFITKPFQPDEVRARVRAAVRRKHEFDDSVQNALIDRITGLFNQQYFESRLEGELARARRSGQALACILVSLDGLRSKNPRFSDVTRDIALYALGRAVLQACRKEDIACRFPDNTIAILAVSMNEASVRALATRIQAIVRSCDSINSETLTLLPVSIGIALSRFSTGMSIVVEASEALARARAACDDRIIVGSELLELQLAG